MVSAAAPLAHLVLVEADSNRTEDMLAAVDQAVAQGAKFVSNSYGEVYTGSDEDPSETTDLDAHYNHPGVAMVAASGDRGFGVVYPAASQFVTAAGGTSLVRDDSARGFSETVWNNACALASRRTSRFSFSINYEPIRAVLANQYALTARAYSLLNL